MNTIDELIQKGAELDREAKEQVFQNKLAAMMTQEERIKKAIEMNPFLSWLFANFDFGDVVVTDHDCYYRVNIKIAHTDCFIKASLNPNGQVSVVFNQKSDVRLYPDITSAEQLSQMIFKADFALRNMHDGIIRQLEETQRYDSSRSVIEHLTNGYPWMDEETRKRLLDKANAYYESENKRMEEVRAKNAEYTRQAQEQSAQRQAEINKQKDLCELISKELTKLAFSPFVYYAIRYLPTLSDIMEDELTNEEDYELDLDDFITTIYTLSEEKDSEGFYDVYVPPAYKNPPIKRKILGSVLDITKFEVSTIEQMMNTHKYTTVVSHHRGSNFYVPMGSFHNEDSAKYEAKVVELLATHG